MSYQSVSTKEAGENKAARWISPTLWIGVIAFMLVAMLAYMTVSASNDLSDVNEAANRSVNPEFSIVQRSAELAAKEAELEMLVANPELRVARRYAEQAAKRAEYFSPETKYAGNSYLNRADRDGRDFLATNPEFKPHRRFVELNGK